MLDANFAVSLDKLQEDLLVVFPKLDDVSFVVEQSADKDIVSKLIWESKGNSSFLKFFQDLINRC